MSSGTERAVNILEAIVSNQGDDKSIHKFSAIEELGFAKSEQV